ncbi:MAG TPA: pitrilysin family protein [Gemmatimonadaceae bacterium]|nr:pitrilysin family protein [Gemmatimonadaceae bacterium]
MRISKRHAAIALLAIAAYVANAPALRAQRATLESIIHRQTLDNGMDVVVVENHAVPIATVEVVVKTGAMSQTPDDQGVPHLFEHMLFKGYRGSGGRPFLQETATLHAGYNGTTSQEQVTYYLTLPSSHTDDAVRVLAHLVRDPHFEKDDLNTERFVVLGEFRRNVSDPRFHLQNEVSQLLWGSEWPRKNTLGDQVALLAVTPEHLKTIFDRYYIPNNAALVVSGDVDPTKVFAAAADRFGSWERAPDPYKAFPVPPMPPLTKSDAVVVTGDVNEITIEIQWPGPSVRSNTVDTYAADVFSAYVDDEQSQLQKRLVDSGIFHTASFGYQTLDHTGPISFYGTASMDKLAAALTVLQAELMTMRADDYFDPELLKVVEKRRSVATAFELEESVGLAHTVGYWWSVAGLDYYMDYTDNLSKRSPSDLSGFVTRYLGDKPFVIGVLAPEKEAPRVRAFLAQYLEMVSASR